LKETREGKNNLPIDEQGEKLHWIFFRNHESKKRME
jgi:hypothetical protein